MIVRRAPAISVCRSQERPKMWICHSTKRLISAPRPAMIAPGRMNRCVGEWTSRKRRWRQPSRHDDSLDSPPRGWYSIGNSAIRSFSFDARITISDANSIPVVRRSSRGRMSRRSARIPQCASETPVLKKTLRMPVSTGLPM